MGETFIGCVDEELHAVDLVECWNFKWVCCSICKRIIESVDSHLDYFIFAWDKISALDCVFDPDLAGRLRVRCIYQLLICCLSCHRDNDFNFAAFIQWYLGRYCDKNTATDLYLMLWCDLDSVVSTDGRLVGAGFDGRFRDVVRLISGHGHTKQFLIDGGLGLCINDPDLDRICGLSGWRILNAINWEA